MDKDIRRVLLKPDAPPPKALGVRLWPTAIPQYNKGHLDILAELEKGVSKFPVLFVGGTYRTGVAFGDCVAYGMDEAKRIETYLVSANAKAPKAAPVQQPKIPAGASAEPKTVIPQAPEAVSSGGASASDAAPKPAPAAPVSEP